MTAVPAIKKTVHHELGDLRLAFGVLSEPFAWGVMALSLVGTMAIFAGLAWLAWWLVGQIGWLHHGWFAGTRWDEWMLGGVGSVLVLVVGWFIFPVIVTAVAGMFLEPLADRIERRYYPCAPEPRKVSIAEQVHSSARVLLLGIGWNLLALPFYFVPVVNVLVYAVLNAFLLSREYFQVVAVRHVPLVEVRQMYRVQRWPLMRGGLSLALLFVVPVINLCAPLLATAWMVHRVWRHDESLLRARFEIADGGEA